MKKISEEEKKIERDMFVDLYNLFILHISATTSDEFQKLFDDTKKLYFKYKNDDKKSKFINDVAIDIIYYIDKKNS